MVDRPTSVIIDIKKTNRRCGAPAHAPKYLSLTVGFFEVKLILTWFTRSTVIPRISSITPRIVSTSRGAFIVQFSIISEWKDTLLAPYCGALHWRKKALFSDEYCKIISVGNTISRCSLPLLPQLSCNFLTNMYRGGLKSWSQVQ